MYRFHWQPFLRGADGKSIALEDKPMTPKIPVVKISIHGHIHEMSVKMMLACGWRPVREIADGPFVSVQFK